MPKVKRQRSCIACRMQDDKVKLHRIVRDSEGHVRFDPAGNAPGRGAYVCSQECFAKVMNSHRLNAALKTTVSKEDYEAIANGLNQALASEEEEN